MKKLNQKGFTLIEVLAVIAIIALLGIIAAPSVLNAIDNSEKSSYNILIENIKTAAVTLYEEVDLLGNTVHAYNTSGNKTGTVRISSKKITVNLQTLVNNGYLKGISNENTTSNGNSMIILNPITDKDMGICSIIITKQVDSNYKTTYTITNNSTSNSSCPTTNQYKNGVE